MPLPTRVPLATSTAARQQEIQQVKEWLKDVIKRNVDTAVVKSLLRGPFRGLLFNVFLQRLRSTEEIKSIRGNLYAMGETVGNHRDIDEDPVDDELLELEKVKKEMDCNLDQLRSDVIMEVRDTLDFKNEVNDIASEVAVQRGCLTDLNQLNNEMTAATATTSAFSTNSNTSSLLNSNSSSRSCDSNSNRNRSASSSTETSMNYLLEESTSLFRSLFLDCVDEIALADQEESVHESIKSISSSVALEDLNRWWEGGIASGGDKFASLEFLFESGAVIDPVEVIKNEFERVGTKLTKEHIETYTKAEELMRQVEDQTEAVRDKMNDAKNELINTTAGLIYPKDFENIICCKTAASLNANIPLPHTPATPPLNEDGKVSSLESSPGSVEEFQMNSRFRNAKRLEDVTLALIRSFPDTCDKVEDVLLENMSI